MPVEKDRFCTEGADFDGADGVEAIATSAHTPFEGVKPGVVLWVNDGETTLSQGNNADITSQPNVIVDTHRPEEKPFDE